MTAKFQNFEFTSEELVLAMVNAANSLRLDNSRVEIVDPTVIIGEHNTQATLRSKVGGGFEGSFPIRYNRLDFDVLFSAYPIVVEPAPFATSEEFLPLINSSYGLKLETKDIVIEAVTIENNRYVLKAKASSVAWFGQTEILFNVDLRAVSNFSVTALNGFDAPYWSEMQGTVTFIPVDDSISPSMPSGFILMPELNGDGQNYLQIPEGPLFENFQYEKRSNLCSGSAIFCTTSGSDMAVAVDMDRVPAAITINGVESTGVILPMLNEPGAVLPFAYLFDVDLDLAAGQPYVITLSSDYATPSGMRSARKVIRDGFVYKAIAEGQNLVATLCDPMVWIDGYFSGEVISFKWPANIAAGAKTLNPELLLNFGIDVKSYIPKKLYINGVATADLSGFVIKAQDEYEAEVECSYTFTGNLPAADGYLRIEFDREPAAQQVAPL